MLRAIRIGHIYGVDVNVHPTFGLAVVWAVWQWGVGPSRGFWALLLGLALVALVFASVLLHELGHCAMAQQFGIRVMDITLWPFGGVARIEQMPAQPRSELLIAVAGPATNLAIFMALLPVLLLIGVLGGWDTLFSTSDPLEAMTLATLLSYLAFINVAILLFNLLPAFPFDGGRMLRAALVPGVGRDRATAIAVTLGIVCAVLFVALGIWQRNLVLILLGIFVVFAARAEARSERVQSAMRRLKVGQYALWDMGGIAPGQPLTFALRGGPRDIAVTDHGRVVGMLWRTQLLDGLAGGSPGRTVADVMDRTVWVADINDSIFDVQQQMNRMNRWAVPVTEAGRYRGIFTADRFVSLYRQISPSVPGPGSIPDEWREAIVETFSSWKRSRRR
jgi:Zn-dependent protease